MFGHHESLAVSLVEPHGHITGQLYVLSLVVAYGHYVGVVEQNVGSLQRRVCEQRRRHEIGLVRLRLELGHAAQLAVAGGALQQPRHLSVLVQMALDEQRARLRVKPHRQKHLREPHGRRPQLLGVVLVGERMQVHHAIHRLVAMLLGHPVLQRPQQVA